MRFINLSVHPTAARIAVKFSTDIHDPQRMKPTDFGDPRTFHLAPSSGQNFNLLLVYDQIPAKHIDIPVSLSCSVGGWKSKPQHAHTPSKDSENGKRYTCLNISMLARKRKKKRSSQLDAGNCKMAFTERVSDEALSETRRPRQC